MCELKPLPPASLQSSTFTVNEETGCPTSLVTTPEIPVGAPNVKRRSAPGRTSSERAVHYALAFDRAARSFKELSPSARRSIEESRLQVREARAGETPASFSRRLEATWSGEEVAVANALEFGESIQMNELLKVALPQPYEGAKP